MITEEDIFQLGWQIKICEFMVRESNGIPETGNMFCFYSVDKKYLMNIFLTPDSEGRYSTVIALSKIKNYSVFDHDNSEWDGSENVFNGKIKSISDLRVIMTCIGLLN